MGQKLKKIATYMSIQIMLLLVLNSCMLYGSIFDAVFPPSMIEVIFDYCSTNNEMTFSNVTDFEWDIAYTDFQKGSDGEKLKEKYGFKDEFEYIKKGSVAYRIAFYKGDKLVKDQILTSLVDLDKSVEIIYPNTRFKCEWQNEEVIDNGKTTTISTLFLTPITESNG
jgi:hypothetical protein